VTGVSDVDWDGGMLCDVDLITQNVWDTRHHKFTSVWDHGDNE
jgi:hypothetical protein